MVKSAGHQKTIKSYWSNENRHNLPLLLARRLLFVCLFVCLSLFLTFWWMMVGDRLPERRDGEKTNEMEGGSPSVIKVTWVTNTK